MRSFRRFLIVLVVLAGLLVVLDRVGAWIAGEAVADQVATELASYDVGSGTPDVSFGGFPFLTQVASGEYREVTVQLSDVSSTDVRLSDVELTATEVTAPLSTLLDGSGSIQAGRLEGIALVDYETVAGLTGLDGLELSAAGSDTVGVRLPVDMLGVSLTLAGTAAVEITDTAIQLRVTELGSGDSSELPPGAETQIEQFISDASVEVPLPPLPYDLAIASVRPAASGLVVALSAKDVPLSR